MCEKKGFRAPPHLKAGVLPPIEPVSQWTIPQKKTNRVGGGGRVRTYFFEKHLEFLGLCFTPKFQTK